MNALGRTILLMTGAAVGLGLVPPAAADDKPADTHGFLKRVYKAGTPEEMKYVVFVPHSYPAGQPYPVILFLHGSGETGGDGVKQSEVGIGPAIKKREQSFPFLAIMPQASKRTWQSDKEPAKLALAVLDEVTRTYKADPDRVYLTGLSMGGYGTWSLAAADPKRWAAIAPVCGGGNPKQADKLKNLPCWVFHGDNDKAVPVAQSRDMVKAIEAAGGKPRYTEYPNVGHNSWDKAYGTDELYTWFLEHKRAAE